MKRADRATRKIPGHTTVLLVSIRPRRFLSGVLAISLVSSILAIVGFFSAEVVTAAPLCTTEALSVSTSIGGPAYYLFESNGSVVSCGGAPLHGSRPHERPSNPIVAGAAAAAGSGYWLASAHGDVFAYGGVGVFGSPAHLRLRSPIVAFAPTPDGKGYWLITATGNLFHYGDASFYGSTVRDQRAGSVVALLATPDGQGYWIVSALGVVHEFGDAPPVGTLDFRRPQIISAAVSPDGRGLLLLAKNGGVYNLGTSPYYGSLVHHRLSRPLTSIASSTDGFGYLLANAGGSIFNFGDATFDGSIAGSPPKRPVGVVDIATVILPTPATLTSTIIAPTSLLPHGAFGYDISNFQCSKAGSSSASSSLPSTSTFSVIEAAGWLDSAQNSCLASEAAWATTAAGPSGAHYSLYLFMNSPDQSSQATALDSTGPAGTCSSLTATSTPFSNSACLAYNYGYEGASAAFNGALAVGVSSSLWWLDVEGTNLSSNQWSNFSAGEYWSSSTTLNDETIQGSIDALRASGITVGIYSSSVQFPTIAGSFIPSGAQIPLWVAGAPWTNPPYTETGLPAPSVLGGWCAGTSGYNTAHPTDLFAGGVPWLLQETPGNEPSPYGIDPDYSC